MMIDLSTAFSKKKALVTGGSGFIGSNLARRLVSLGTQVTVVDNFAPNLGGNPYNLHDISSQIKLVTADISNEKEMAILIPSQEFIFNLAGQVSHLDSMLDPQNDLQMNALAQVALLEMCRKWNPAVRIVYAGTRQVYGRPHYLPVDEVHPIEPVDFNGVSKMAGEWYHCICHNVYGMRTTVLRMTNVYGPRMRVKDARKTFVGIWFRQLIEGNEITIYGNGKQIRDFTYVEDVVDALLLSAITPQAEGQVYNLGARPISLLQLAELLVKINGGGSYRFEPFPAERLRIDIGDYCANTAKIVTHIGWRPVVTLESGIELTLDYYRKNRQCYF
jgi:UDP-glucose 4-epimerase